MLLTRLTASMCLTRLPWYSRVEAEASVGHEEDDDEEEIGAADKDEQMCSAACLGRLSLACALAAVDFQVMNV